MAINSQLNPDLKISYSITYQVSVTAGLQIRRSPFAVGRRGISSRLSLSPSPKTPQLACDLSPLRRHPRFFVDYNRHFGHISYESVRHNFLKTNFRKGNEDSVVYWGGNVHGGPHITRTGVMAGKATGIEAVAVPSHPKDSHLDKDEVINSLNDLQPENCDLPPFEDWIKGTLPIKPWYIGGPVIKGFGRGSKMLGIPTANLSTEGYSAVLSERRSGVYFGWAGLSTRGIYKMVMSVGWNPYFNNAKKTIEPWLLHEFGDNFYGEDLRLAIVGYIRPEANFPSLEGLIEKIHEDRRIAETALELPIYKKYREDPYLKSSFPEDTRHP